MSAVESTSKMARLRSRFIAASSERLPPEVKPRPSPVTTRARTASSSSAARIASLISWTNSVVKELSVSGRLSVSQATPPSTR